MVGSLTEGERFGRFPRNRQAARRTDPEKKYRVVDALARDARTIAAAPSEPRLAELSRAKKARRERKRAVAYHTPEGGRRLGIVRPVAPGRR